MLTLTKAATASKIFQPILKKRSKSVILRTKFTLTLLLNLNALKQMLNKYLQVSFLIIHNSFLFTIESLILVNKFLRPLPQPSCFLINKQIFLSQVLYYFHKWAPVWKNNGFRQNFAKFIILQNIKRKI